jgi:eukaryotic-like serine/threonine-protein kinase
VDAERWQLLADLLADVLERPATDRDAFLLRRCAGDPTLLDEARAFLAASGDDAFLAAPLFSFAPAGADPNLGRRLRGYRLDSLLGRGGMGAVYRAARVDGPFERQVAIKLLRRGLDSDEILRRFHAEQRILAQLEHPGIARLIDGDSAEDGAPYFVLELVEGEPIDVFCREHGLSLRRRVELLAKVGDAVGEAHRHLVVHRDLKPANILVRPDGEPKLLDFGIAKLLAEEAPGLTDGRQVGPMTPEYASPEQRQGGPITTATDIYALGLLGRQLLAGAPQKLGRDLEAILAKALRNDPTERYATAPDLTDDLRRFLDGRPVGARPDSFLYVATRLARRHPVASGALAAATALIVIVAAAMTWQRQRIARQAEEITRERDRAQAVLGFLVDFLRSPDPSRARGEALTVKEALAAAEAQLESDLEKEPAVRAELFGAVGDVYRNLALYEEARAPLEQALALRRAETPQSPAYADALHDLALLERHLGHVGRAAQLMEEAIGLGRAHWPEGHPDLARGLNNYASLLLELDRTEEAENLAREGLAMKERLLRQDHPDVATSLNTLATIRRKRGDLGQAESHYRRCLELRRRELPPLDPQLPKAINNLAGVLREKGALDEAGELYREALALRRKIFPDGQHPDLLTSLSNLALLERDRGRLDEAEKLLQEAVAAARRSQASRLLPALEKNLASVLAAAAPPLACPDSSLQCQSP